MTSKGASILFDHLNKHKSILAKINLNDCQMDDECIESLGNYIKNNEYIEIICLGNYLQGNNKITDKGIEILSNYLIGNKTFKELMLNKNKGITDKSIPFLMKMIETSHIIDIYRNNFNYR